MQPVELPLADWCVVIALALLMGILISWDQERYDLAYNTTTQPALLISDIMMNST